MPNLVIFLAHTGRLASGVCAFIDRYSAIPPMATPSNSVVRQETYG
jgi:hypothetical protein